MRFEYFLVALPLIAAGAPPVMAQDITFVPGTGEAVAFADGYDDIDPAVDDEGVGLASVANKIGDPAVQDGVAAAVERVTGTMMNLPVGRFADAVERARPGTVDRRIRDDATVADIAGRDARYLPEELGERSREAMGIMSGFAKALAVMMPEFERMGREMEESFKEAKAETKAGRY